MNNSVYYIFSKYWNDYKWLWTRVSRVSYEALLYLCQFYLCQQHELRFPFALNSPVRSWNSFMRKEAVSMKEFRLQQRYILHPVGCVKAQMSLCHRSKVQKLFMRNVCCVWRRMVRHSLYSVLLRQWGCKDHRTKGEGHKRLKTGGESGCEPTLSRAFCNQRWEYYPHKSTINLSSGP